mmetsp:Transcript_32080/g.81617  ORF Transcript_32080/g.81617 Transcript_32080/m.81617 type:complete len:247 (-) Transcript_32080:870-1610(-)
MGNPFFVVSIQMAMLSLRLPSSSSLSLITCMLWTSLATLLSSLMLSCEAGLAMDFTLALALGASRGLRKAVMLQALSAGSPISRTPKMWVISPNASVYCAWYSCTDTIALCASHMVTCVTLGSLPSAKALSSTSADVSLRHLSRSSSPARRSRKQKLSLIWFPGLLRSITSSFGDSCLNFRSLSKWATASHMPYSKVSKEAPRLCELRAAKVARICCLDIRRWIRNMAVTITKLYSSAFRMRLPQL